MELILCLEDVREECLKDRMTPIEFSHLRERAQEAVRVVGKAIMKEGPSRRVIVAPEPIGDQKSVSVNEIWLRKDGRDKVVVLAEFEGQWGRVIQETWPDGGEFEISHIVEPSGIKAAVKADNCPV